MHACTCAAERKPPLFNINAMSALYHIAQDPAPALNTEAYPWSMLFVDFVSRLCLVKNYEQRASTHECLKHAFIDSARPPNLLSSLVQRTKQAVREYDNLQSRRECVHPHSVNCA
jgi:thousand and one amino acid protein kinase